MNLQKYIRREFLRRLVATAEGRAHLLNLMVNAEEGDEVGTFDRLQVIVEDPRLRKTIARHQADERVHASLYRACLLRTGVEPESIPAELMIIRRVAREAGGVFAAATRRGSSDSLESRDDVMNTYAMLLAIEERGVQQFPLIGREFRLIGDRETADTFDRVAKDELRHTKYCHAIGRRYAPDEATWQRTVGLFRAIEARAYHQAGLASMAYAIDRGFVWKGRVAKLVAATFHRLDPMSRVASGAPALSAS